MILVGGNPLAGSGSPVVDMSSYLPISCVDGMELASHRSNNFLRGKQFLHIRPRT